MIPKSECVIIMRNKILTIMGFVILAGLVIQGIFGIAAGIFISAIIGLCYGIFKKDRNFLKWSSIALFIDVACIITFYICLINSDM